MEFPKEILEGLKNLQDVDIIPEKTFVHIVELVLSHVGANDIDGKRVSKIRDSDCDIVKRAFTDIVCLFVEAARHDLDGNTFGGFLANKHINGQRGKILNETYVSSKTDIQAQLELIGSNPPHIVDVSWRLDYCIKSSSCDSLAEPLYHIQLNTKEHQGLRYVTFTCTIQQLQELVAKMKDASRHLEKLSNL
ncbi:hypothetical protein KM043_013903 [Ampulex compressa]|nr:hypothetical protein KM043_013903 [Ampulex compressa]